MSSSPHSLVVFSIDERQFALDIAAVKSVHRSVEISPLPESPTVVLGTSMGSREFQERGIEAGANAYIVKSNFDQSNLLEIIRKLL